MQRFVFYYSGMNKTRSESIAINRLLVTLVHSQVFGSETGLKVINKVITG